MKPLAEIIPIVREIGWGSARLLQSYYRGESEVGNLEIHEKKDGPVTSADLAVNHYILQQLQTAFPHEPFGYLTEETYKSYVETHGQNPLPQPWVWIIDPLDGTRDFIDKTGEYAVHIALVKSGKPMLAVVAWPEQEKVYYAIKGGGTFVEYADGTTQKLQVSAKSAITNLSMVVSRSHRGQRFEKLLQKFPYQGQIAVGSIGCKIATIVEQKAEIYMALSGKSAPKDWDLAAPELILTEAGGAFTYFDKTDLLYNQKDINHWGGLLASNGTCHEFLCEQATEILAEIDEQS